MRKILISLVVSVFILITGFLVTGIRNKLFKKEQIIEKISSFPSFYFSTLDEKTFNSSQIREGPVLVVRFHPECEHCQYEISELYKSNLKSSKITVLLISSANRDSIKEFLSQFKYTEVPGFVPLIDSSYVFGEVFGKDVVPANYIYNRDLKLTKVFYGEVKMETILSYLDSGK